MRGRGTSTRPDPQIKSALTSLLWLAVILVSAVGCSSGTRGGGLISTNLSISSYAEARQHADPTGKESRFYFPILEIYNQAGAVVYVSHESVTNAQILKEFPNSIRNLAPKNEQPLLEKIVEQIPDFRLRKEEILGKKMVILSVSLQDCGSCAMQEQALAQVRQRLLQQQSVAILEINVEHP